MIWARLLRVASARRGRADEPRAQFALVRDVRRHETACDSLGPPLRRSRRANGPGTQRVKRTLFYIKKYSFYIIMDLLKARKNPLCVKKQQKNEVAIHTLPYSTHYRPALPFGNRKIYFRGSFQFSIVTI